MSQLLRTGLRLVVLVLASSVIPVADAAQVRGTVQLPPPATTSELMGYTRTRVAAPSTVQAPHDVALFLKVVESLPLSDTKTPATLRLFGLTLSPGVAACAVDGKVTIKNDDAMPVTVRVGKNGLGRLQPGAQKTYECTAGESGGDQRVVRIVEWPHIRGMIYVGEVGVAGQADERGSFSLEAPTGRYELHVIRKDGVPLKREVEIVRGDVDVGLIDLTSSPSGEPSE